MNNSNGRVNLIQNNNLTKYDFFNEKNKNTNHFQKEATRHILTSTKVSELFFSRSNIDILHNGIRYSVFNATKEKHIISRQSDTELQIVMRSIYLQYSKNLDKDVVKQVKELNSKVLDYVVPKVLVELNQYVNYKKDLTYLPVPLERSKNMSSSGTKFLFVKEF